MLDAQRHVRVETRQEFQNVNWKKSFTMAKTCIEKGIINFLLFRRFEGSYYLVSLIQDHNSGFHTRLLARFNLLFPHLLLIYPYPEICFAAA